MGLKRLDAYISRSRSWLSAILVLGAAYVIERTARLGRFANTDWTHKAASTVAVGAVAVAAIGLTAISPDSIRPEARVPATAPGLAAGPSAGENAPQAPVSDVGPVPLARLLNTDSPPGVSPRVKPIKNPPVAGTQPGTGGRHPNQGCDGNPTSAAPPVPVGSPTSHSAGAPVSHPTAGGCRA